MRKIKTFIARNYEGVFYGGLIGLVLFLARNKVNIIQKVLVGNSWLGNISTFIFIGMSIGILIDAIYKPKK